MHCLLFSIGVPTKLNKIKYLLLPLLTAVAIFIISDQQQIIVPKIGIQIEDKILHFIAYTFFGLTIIYSIYGYRQGINKKKLLTILLVVGSLYALSDEFHQYYVPGRSADVWDFIADFLGVYFSYFLYPILKKILTKFKEKSV